jgi:sulfite exporter TauE/SafE/plastocyanin domain-containing protein/copper chaperone CopZ
MKKITISIAGMHCRSCEILIEEELRKIPEISKSKANFKKSSVEIYYDSQKPNEKGIEEAIRSAGYVIGAPEEKSLVSRNASDYKDLGIAFLFLLGIYLLLKNFGLTNLNFAGGASNPSSLWVVLLVGLTAGVSTCMALVGGLVLGLSTRHAEKHSEATTLQKFRPHLYFNAGRILGFALLGGLLGSLGSIFQISTLALGILTILVGAVMLVMGLQLVEIFPRLNGLKLTLPKFLSRSLGIKNHEKEYSHRSSAIMGALTFFLPCGFTQAMQLYAVSTGSFANGALVMGLFALGTAPGLLGIGGITSAVKGIFAKRFFKFAGILVIFFALFNLSNGYNLTGWQWASGNSLTSKNILGNDPNVSQENGVQIVRMKQLAGGYSPNKFTIKKDVPVRWVITSEEPYSCASSLVIPKLGISKKLSAGENVIEFTPKETGALKFSCSMGMFTGVFNVVDEQGGGANAADLKSVVKPSGGSCGISGGSGGCGGCGGPRKPVETKEGTVEQSGGANTDASPSEQIVRTNYTLNEDILPNTFTVKAGVPVKFMVDVKEDGQGCMSSIMIPGLYNTPQYLQKGKLEMDFTPTKTGIYQITCAMGVPRGTIKVN